LLRLPTQPAPAQQMAGGRGWRRHAHASPSNTISHSLAHHAHTHLSPARRPRAQENSEPVGWLTAALGGLRRLEALALDCTKDGSSLSFLGLATAGLSQNLRSLDIKCSAPPGGGGGEEEEPPFANLSFLARLAPSLQSLVLEVPTPPRDWLYTLTQLTKIDIIELSVSTGSTAQLSALTRLQDLECGRWRCAGASVPPAASLASVTKLTIWNAPPHGLASLAAAFPGAREAVVQLLEGDYDDESDDDEAAAAAAPPPARTAARAAAAAVAPVQPPWRELSSLHLRGFETLLGDDAVAAFGALLALLEGARGLSVLHLEGARVTAATPMAGDAHVAALLAAVAPTATRLCISPVGSLTDAAIAGCPLHPAVQWLGLYPGRPSPFKLSPAGLLALGRAMPGLELLSLEDANAAAVKRWVKKLDALRVLGGRGRGAAAGGSGAAGGGSASDSVSGDSASGGYAQPAEGSGNAILLAIRRALAREAAAGVRLA